MKNKSKECKYLISSYLLEDHDLSKTQHIFRWIFLNGFFAHNVDTLLYQNNTDNYMIEENVYKSYIENYSIISPKEKIDHFLVSLFEFCDDSFSFRSSINDFI